MQGARLHRSTWRLFISADVNTHCTRTARALHAHCTPCRTPVEVCRFNVWVAVWLGQTVSVHVFKCPVFKRAVSGVQCSQLTADTLV